jgi:hypothetical protein
MLSCGRYVSTRVIPVLVLAATTAFMGAPAGSAEPVMAGVMAKHGAKSLNLARSWGTARSCVVYTGRKTECFDSNAQADAALVRRGLAGPGPLGTWTRRLGWYAAPVSRRSRRRLFLAAPAVGCACGKTATATDDAYVSYVGSVWNDEADWVHP